MTLPQLQMDAAEDVKAILIGILHAENNAVCYITFVFVLWVYVPNYISHGSL
jgi:capsule polysaccharide modification protein KpsS